MTSAILIKPERVKNGDCEHKGTVAPGVGSYETVEAFHYMRDAHSHHAALTEKKAKPPFFGVTKRFGKVPDEVNRNTDPDNPGPADYDAQLDEIGGKGFTCSRAPRKLFSINDVPGPGTYHLHPCYSNTVLRDTFNVTLGNPLSRRKIHKRAGLEMAKNTKKHQ
ncbi:sperm-tail PG-rich repeat-containing protein 2-like [Periplaneta americana]|uniref:sperm-tail PG-rich repeat-containing protein 2-like n=1 Tax=Periplaneta americana TaxID=6978 RepID=UPI0037E792EC